MQLYHLMSFLFFTPFVKKNYLHTNIIKKFDLYSKKKNFEINNKNNYIPKTYNQEEYQKSLNNPYINLLFCNRLKI